MQKDFKKEIDSLGAIFAFVEDFFKRHRIDPSHLPTVNLAVEEIFTNMVKYQTGNTRDIRISLDSDEAQILLCLTDFEVDRFDPSEAPVADTDAPLSEREVGGLGLHLVRKMMDGIEYEYSNRVGKITMTKMID